VIEAKDKSTQAYHDKDPSTGTVKRAVSENWMQKAKTNSEVMKYTSNLRLFATCRAERQIYVDDQYILPLNDFGKYCWCQGTKGGNYDLTLPWIQAVAFDGGQDQCAEDCAKYCANYVGATTDSKLRTEILTHLAP